MARIMRHPLARFCVVALTWYALTSFAANTLPEYAAWVVWLMHAAGLAALVWLGVVTYSDWREGQREG